MTTTPVNVRDRAEIRDRVKDDPIAAALVERVLERPDELERYVGGMGPPFMPQMG